MLFLFDIIIIPCEVVNELLIEQAASYLHKMEHSHQLNTIHAHISNNNLCK